MTEINNGGTSVRGHKWFIRYYRVGDVALCTLFGLTFFMRVGNLNWVLGCTFELGE